MRRALQSSRYYSLRLKLRPYVGKFPNLSYPFTTLLSPICPFLFSPLLYSFTILSPLYNFSSLSLWVSMFSLNNIIYRILYGEILPLSLSPPPSFLKLSAVYLKSLCCVNPYIVLTFSVRSLFLSLSLCISLFLSLFLNLCFFFSLSLSLSFICYLSLLHCIYFLPPWIKCMTWNKMIAYIYTYRA